MILDGSDPVGPAEGLFDRAFFEGVRRALAKDGVLVAQSEIHRRLRAAGFRTAPPREALTVERSRPMR